VELLYENVIVISLVLATLGAAAAVRYPIASVFAVVIALLLPLMVPISEYLIYVAFIVVIGFTNIASLFIPKNTQIRGADISLVALIALATVYVLYTKDLALILTAFILASVPTYVLIMISDVRANVDVAIKYITFMVFATILFIIGAVMLVYSSYIKNDVLYTLSFVILITGLCLEVGCAPLHEWVPDVFTAGDPIPISIIASIAKIVPFVAALKIILLTSSTAILPKLLFYTAVISVISMFVGNIGALTAKELSRVLAYSTVANMGYILAAFSAISYPEILPLAFAGIFMQLLVNAFGKIGFFASIKGAGAATVSTYILALSFIGLPPLLGFWSKLFILLAVANAGYLWVALALVANSAISIPYYLRLARELGKPWVLNSVNTVVLFTVLMMLITILPPYWILDPIRSLVLKGIFRGVFT